MKRRSVYAALFAAILWPAAALSAQTAAGLDAGGGLGAILARSDGLSSAERYDESIALLNAHLRDASTDTDRAEIYWRLSREIFDKAQIADDDGASSDQLVPQYEQSENDADCAISLDPKNANGYFWKAADLGRIAQERNLVAAFLSADKVRQLEVKATQLAPADADPWYVLAQLYYQVPGPPISFGNAEYAVSLGRFGLDLRRAQVSRGSVADLPDDYENQLAMELAHRNWSAAERTREHAAEARAYANASDPMQRAFFYEGHVSIPDESDRQEAVAITQQVVAHLQSLATLTHTQRDDLGTARKNLADWGGSS